jgi:hypothetical protein
MPSRPRRPRWSCGLLSFDALPVEKPAIIPERVSSRYRNFCSLFSSSAVSLSSYLGSGNRKYLGYPRLPRNIPSMVPRPYRYISNQTLAAAGRQESASVLMPA